MKYIIPSIFISVVLESTLVALPVTLAVIVFAAIVTQGKSIFLLAFIAGLLLDILALRTIGVSSLVFVVLIFLIYQYSGKFEIKTLNFFAVFIFFSSLSYLFIINGGNIFLESILLTLISVVSFFIYNKSINSKKAPSYI